MTPSPSDLTMGNLADRLLPVQNPWLLISTWRATRPSWTRGWRWWGRLVVTMVTTFSTHREYFPVITGGPYQPLLLRVTVFCFSLMWDLQHKLIYCPVYKVASGTWTTNFLRLSKFNEDLPKWQRFSKLHGASESASRKLFPPPAGKTKQKKLLKTMTKFLVVRHPFDRIVSAYTGKIANPMAKPRYYRKLQKEIIKKYRSDWSKNTSPPTFAEYVRYLLDLTDDLTNPKDWRVVDCVQAYYSVCAPCDVKYDVIVKLETHDEDTEFLIRRNNLTELQEPFTMWKHSSKGQNSIGDYEYYVYDEPYRYDIFTSEVVTITIYYLEIPSTFQQKNQPGGKKLARILSLRRWLPMRRERRGRRRSTRRVCLVSWRREKLNISMITTRLISRCSVMIYQSL